MIKRKASSLAVCPMKGQDNSSRSNSSASPRKKSKTSAMPIVAPLDVNLLASSDKRNKQTHRGNARKQHQNGVASRLTDQTATNQQQQQQEQPVWIYGLINNIEQMLSQFNNKQRLQQVVQQQQLQQQQQQQQRQDNAVACQQQHQQMTVTNNFVKSNNSGYGAKSTPTGKSAAAKSRSSAHSSGYSTPSSLYSSASLSPPISTSSSLNSCAYSSSSTSNSPISASSLVSTSPPHKSANNLSSTADFKSGDSSASASTSSCSTINTSQAAINQQQQQQQQQQQLPRSPISRQIKFHEYKGPPQAKRPTKTQQQPQVNPATTAPQATKCTKETNSTAGTSSTGASSLHQHDTRHSITSSLPNCIVVSQVAPPRMLPLESQMIQVGQQQALAQLDGQQLLILSGRNTSKQHSTTNQQHQLVRPMKAPPPAPVSGGPVRQYSSGNAQMMMNNYVTHSSRQSSLGCQFIQQHRPFSSQQPAVSVQVVRAAQQNIGSLTTSDQQVSHFNLHQDHKHNQPQQQQQQQPQPQEFMLDSVTFQQMQMQHGQQDTTQGPVLLIQDEQTIEYNTNDKSNTNNFTQQRQPLKEQTVHDSLQTATASSYNSCLPEQTGAVDYDDIEYDLNATYDNIEPTISFNSDPLAPNGVNSASGGSSSSSEQLFDDTLLFSEFIDLQDIPLNVDESDWLRKFLPPCSSI